MRRLFIFLCVLMFTITAFGQDFEGRITYKINYQSKIPKVKSRKLTKMMGSAQEYFIKDGNYKTVMSGSYFQWQLYLHKENRLYNKMANSDILYWIDGASNRDTVLNTEIHKEAAKILGYKCDEVILTCKNGVEKYYFSKEFPVNSELFAHHQYGNWYEFLSIANAVPLKLMIDHEQFTLESTAVEIKEMKLDSTMFELPPNTQSRNILMNGWDNPNNIADQYNEKKQSINLKLVKYISSFFYRPLLF